MPSIILALDFGGSGLRGIYTTVETFSPKLFLMQPEVTLATRESLTEYASNKIGTTDPTRCAWVEYNEQCFAVGNLALVRFRANLQLQKRKFELAIPKVLAAIGAISQVHELDNGTAINLGIVLPYNEFRDRDHFEKLLGKAITSYKFCGMEKSFTLNTFICLPEGGGVLTQAREKGTSFARLDLVVLMLGFRDVSLLYVDHGEMSRGLTASLGFANLVNAVSERTSLQNYQQLTAAICKAGRNINQRALAPLIQNVGETYREYELSKLYKAIIEARAQYWLTLREWLNLQIKADVDEIIVAGGTAQFLKPELSTFLTGATSTKTKILWCSELEKRIASTFAVQIKQNSLSYRLADVYGLFFYLHDRLRHNHPVKAGVSVHE